VLTAPSIAGSWTTQAVDTNCVAGSVANMSAGGAYGGGLTPLGRPEPKGTAR
jgi:hypothetical protein